MVIFHVYYLQLQTYVLRLDVVLQGIALAFVGVEALLKCRACAAGRRCLLRVPAPARAHPHQPRPPAGCAFAYWRSGAV